RAWRTTAGDPCYVRLECAEHRLDIRLGLARSDGDAGVGDRADADHRLAILRALDALGLAAHALVEGRLGEADRANLRQDIGDAALAAVDGVVDRAARQRQAGPFGHALRQVGGEPQLVFDITPVRELLLRGGAVILEGDERTVAPGERRQRLRAAR